MKISFLSVVLLLSFWLATPAMALLQPGERAPDFSVKNLKGEEIRLSDLKGDLLLVEMGTTWCPSCNEQAKQVDKLRAYLKKKNIKTISVFLADSPSSIREHLKEEGLQNPDQILIDSGEARNNYSIFSIPRLLLIDKDMKIVFDEMILSSEEIKQRAEKHLQQN